jgi:hypothetical protein
MLSRDDALFLSVLAGTIAAAIFVTNRDSDRDPEELGHKIGKALRVSVDTFYPEESEE